jgi:NAD(P)-dependent dehydrogenase (short-subunit alcohol dehydrogenase family)
MGRLENKVAVITGAASGIGLAISKAFAKESAYIVMGDINMDKCTYEAGRLEQNALYVRAFQCDVGDPNGIESLIKFTIETYGKIDILINNAAIAKDYDIMCMTEEELEELINVNLKSVFRGIKMSLPFMLKQKSGSIISISSVQAFRSWDNWTAYAGIKGAILSLTNQLAGQYGKYNIRFNTISPGAIMTPLNEERIKNEGTSFLQKSEAQASMNRIGTSQEVAMAAVFLASDEASFITGEDLKVDGGLCTLPRYI